MIIAVDGGGRGGEEKNYEVGRMDRSCCCQIGRTCRFRGFVLSVSAAAGALNEEPFPFRRGRSAYVRGGVASSNVPPPQDEIAWWGCFAIVE